MKMKNGIILATVLVIAAAALFVGCKPSQFTDLQEGDVLTDGFQVTFVDPAGGFEAQQFTLDEEGKITETPVDEGGKSVMKASGTFTTDRTWTAASVWYLENLVFIGDDTADNAATLTIEAGTTVKGISSVTPGTLVITRNSKIMAEGTASAPIVMTSALPAGSRGAGDWGGLVINGLAHLNETGGTAEGEGNSGTYGGGSSPVNDDNSGTLKYVRVEYAGRVFTSEDELNGIAFQAVGSGTTVDYIQVHQNKDDGVEFFGGTVNVSHVVLTGNQDDSMDWTSGWTGTAQYVVIQHYGSGDQAIEADNLEGSVDAAPRSAPVLKNFTMIGNGSSEGALFRRGTNAKLYNSILTNFDVAGGEALDETHDSGDANEVVYAGVLVDSAGAVGDSTMWTAAGNDESGVHNLPTTDASNHIATLWGVDEDGNTTYVPGDVDGNAHYSFGVEPTAAISAPAPSSEADSFIGAVKPGSDWTAGWITTTAN